MALAVVDQLITVGSTNQTDHIIDYPTSAPNGDFAVLVMQRVAFGDPTTNAIDDFTRVLVDAKFVIWAGTLTQARGGTTLTIVHPSATQVICQMYVMSDHDGVFELGTFVDQASSTSILTGAITPAGGNANYWFGSFVYQAIGFAEASTPTGYTTQRQTGTAGVAQYGDKIDVQTTETPGAWVIDSAEAMRGVTVSLGESITPPPPVGGGGFAAPIARTVASSMAHTLTT